MPRRALLLALALSAPGCVVSYGFDYEIDPPAPPPPGPSGWVAALVGARPDVADRVRPAGPRALATDEDTVYLLVTSDEALVGCDGELPDGARGSFVAAFERETGAPRWCHAVASWTSSGARAEAALVATSDGVLVASPRASAGAPEEEQLALVRFDRAGARTEPFATPAALARVRPADLAVLADGRILVAATAEAPDGSPAALDLGGCSVPYGLQRPFVAAFDPSGACAWAAGMDGEAQGFDPALAVDPASGAALVTFTAHGTFTFGGAPAQIDPFANDDVSFAGCVAPLDLATGTASQVLALGWVYLPGLAGDPGLGVVRALPRAGAFELTASLVGDPLPDLCPAGCSFGELSHGFNVLVGEYSGGLSERDRFAGDGDEAVTATAQGGADTWVAGTYTKSSELAPDVAHEPGADAFVARVGDAATPVLSLHAAGVVTVEGLAPVAGGLILAGSVGGDTQTPAGPLVVPSLSDLEAFLLFVPSEAP